MDTNNNNQEGREERTPIQNQPYGGWTAGGPSGQTAGPSYTQNPYAYGNAANPYASTGTPVQPGQKPAKKRGGMVGLMLAGMLAFGMLVGGAGAEAVMIATGHGSPLAATATTQGTGGNATTSTELTAQSNQATINGIYKTISPSVVMINSVIQSTGRSGGFGGGTGQATGTGIVIDKQGDILTNNHVIEGGSNIKVVFSDGTEYAATVVGTAAQDDLAIIKV